MQRKLTKPHTVAVYTPCAVMYILPPLILKEFNLLIWSHFTKSTVSQVCLIRSTQLEQSNVNLH